MLTPKRNRLLLKITGWPRLGFLNEIFEDAKFIHLVRDGRAVASSLLHVDFWRGWYGPQGWRAGLLSPEDQATWEAYDRSFVALAGLEWRIQMRAMEAARRALPDPARFLEIKYETFCEQPLETCRRALDFAELPGSTAFERHVAATPIKNASHRWRDGLTVAAATSSRRPPARGSRSLRVRRASAEREDLRDRGPLSRVTDPTSSLTHRTIRGMAWVAWWSGAIAVMRLGVLILLTRLLAPADFGVVSAAMVFITFSFNFSQLGMGPALVQRPALEARHTSTAFFASAALGVLVAGVVWAAAPIIARFFHMDELVPVVRALAFVFPIAGLSVAPESLLQREMRFRLLANRDVLAYGLGYGVVGVALALLGYGVWALVVAQLTQAVLRTAILLHSGPPVLRGAPDLAELPRADGVRRRAKRRPPGGHCRQPSG